VEPNGESQHPNGKQLQCYILPQLTKLRLEQFSVEHQQKFITSVLGQGVSRKTVLNVLEDAIGDSSDGP
jgi:hypothetical protein